MDRRFNRCIFNTTQKTSITRGEDAAMLYQAMSLMTLSMFWLVMQLGQISALPTASTLTLPTAYFDLCLCNHGAMCIVDIEPRMMENELFLCLSSSETIGDVLDLSLHQQRFQVDRIVDSKCDTFTWVTYPQQHFCVIRTRLDSSFFRWRRRGFTNVDIRGTVMVGLVNHDFELKIPIQPNLRLLSPMDTQKLLVYVFFITVILLGLVLIVEVLWGCYKKLQGRQQKITTGAESEQQTIDVEK